MFDSKLDEETLNEFLDFLSRYSKDKQALFSSGMNYEQWWDHLVSTGWTRAHLYTLYMRTLYMLPDYAPEYIVDLVDTEISGLIGHCSGECISRLVGDPDGQDELVRYARGMEWMPKEFRDKES